jgi:CysZ protein
MIRALVLTLQQLGDRGFIRVLAKSLFLTALIFVAFGFVLWTLFQRMSLYYGWHDPNGLIAFVALLGALAAGWVMFRAVAIPVMGFFADEIVAAIELRHYPSKAATARPTTVARALSMGLASASRVILVNLAALPAYIALIGTAIGPLIVFAGVNAVLLGRDLGEMVAARHLDPDAMKPWLRASRVDRGIAGLIVTGLFTIPFVNLLAPLIGAGMMTHIFHRRMD